MAAFNFPSSPSNGDNYSANGVTFTYNSSSGAWIRASAVGAQGATGNTGAQGATGAAGSNGGTDIVNDSSPQLGGDLDTNTKNIFFGDSSNSSNNRLQFGTTDKDLQIYHDGSHSRVAEGGTGNLILSTNGGTVSLYNTSNSEDLAKFISNGAVELYHNNTKRFETTSSGVKVSDGHLFLDDNQNIKLGNSNDFLIYHNGSNSIINDNGTGNLELVTNNGAKITLQGGSDTMANFIKDGAVELYHNNTKVFETTSSGAKVQKSGEVITLIGSTNGDGVYLSLDGASNGDGAGGDHASISHDSSGNFHIKTDNPSSNASIVFSTNGSTRTVIDESGHLKPISNNTYDLGTSSKRWRNLYINDLQLSNKGETNNVDGTWGDWTLQEGESDVYMINNRSGKKFKIKMEEVE